MTEGRRRHHRGWAVCLKAAVASLSMDDLEAFAQAWRRFGHECAATVAPEATYQAWFAHHLMEHFGVLRVVREVDFGSKYLDEAAQSMFSGHNLMLI